MFIANIFHISLLKHVWTFVITILYSKDESSQHVKTKIYILFMTLVISPSNEKIHHRYIN